MALSKEENETLTRVGRGQPAGELLRRYWQPIGFANELQASPSASGFLAKIRVVSRRAWKVRRAGAALHASRHLA